MPRCAPELAAGNECSLGATARRGKGGGSLKQEINCPEFRSRSRAASERLEMFSDVWLARARPCPHAGGVTEINSPNCSPSSLPPSSPPAFTTPVATLTRVNGSAAVAATFALLLRRILSATQHRPRRRRREADRGDRRDSFPGKMCEEIFQLTATAPLARSLARPFPRWFSGPSSPVRRSVALVG